MLLTNLFKYQFECPTYERNDSFRFGRTQWKIGKIHTVIRYLGAVNCPKTFWKSLRKPQRDLRVFFCLLALQSFAPVTTVAKFVNNFNAFLLCFALLPCLLLLLPITRKKEKKIGIMAFLSRWMDQTHSRRGINAKAGKLFRKSLIEHHILEQRFFKNFTLNFRGNNT